jgi:hypothetical protein
MDTIKKKAAKAKILAALTKTAGNISAACKAAAVSRSWFYQEFNADPEFKAACNDIAEATGDFVESALMKQIQEGNTACIIFFCKTKLKQRGFVERQELEHSGDVGIKNGGEMTEEQFAALKAAAEIG